MSDERAYQSLGKRRRKESNANLNSEANCAADSGRECSKEAKPLFDVSCLTNARTSWPMNC